jgi:hypothetical protein
LTLIQQTAAPKFKETATPWPLYHQKKTGRSLGHSIFLTFSLGKINGAILPTGRFTAEKAVWRVSRAQVVTAPAKPLDY